MQKEISIPSKRQKISLIWRILNLALSQCLKSQFEKKPLSLTINR